MRDRTRHRPHRLEPFQEFRVNEISELESAARRVGESNKEKQKKSKMPREQNRHQQTRRERGDQRRNIESFKREIK